MKRSTGTTLAKGGAAQPPLQVVEVLEWIFDFYSPTGARGLSFGGFVKLTREAPGWLASGPWIAEAQVAKIFRAHCQQGSPQLMQRDNLFGAVGELAAHAFPGEGTAALPRFLNEIFFHAPAVVLRRQGLEGLPAATPDEVPVARVELCAAPWSGYVKRVLDKRLLQQHEAQYLRHRSSQRAGRGAASTPPPQFGRGTKLKERVLARQYGRGADTAGVAVRKAPPAAKADRAPAPRKKLTTSAARLPAPRASHGTTEATGAQNPAPAVEAATLAAGAAAATKQAARPEAVNLAGVAPAAGEGAAPKPLPPHWREVQDPETGETYFFHAKSLVARWDRPTSIPFRKAPSRPPPAVPSGAAAEPAAASVGDTGGSEDEDEDEAVVLLSALKSDGQQPSDDDEEELPHLFKRLRHRLKSVHSTSMRSLLEEKTKPPKSLWTKLNVAVAAAGRFTRMAAEQAESEAASTLGAAWRGAAARSVIALRRKRHAHRTRVVQELAHTERTYCFSLTAAIEHFVMPLRALQAEPGSTLAKAMAAALPPPKMQQLFGNIEQLQALSGQICEALQEKLSAWSPVARVGATLKHFAPFLRLYGAYCRGYHESSALLAQLDASSAAWAQFRDAALTSGATAFGGLSLSSILVMPVQRVPRYVLLLRELIKNTWQEHCDYDVIVEALTLMEGVAQDVNNAIGVRESVIEVVGGKNEGAKRMSRLKRYATAAMFDCQASFGAFVDVLAPSRKLLYDQPMLLVGTYMGPDSIDREAAAATRADGVMTEMQAHHRCFLFNDLLVIGDAGGHVPTSILQRVRGASSAMPPPPPPRQAVASASAAAASGAADASAGRQALECTYGAHVRIDAALLVFAMEVPVLIPNCLRVINTTQAVVLTIQASSQEERDTWIDTLEQLREEEVSRASAVAQRVRAASVASPGRALSDAPEMPTSAPPFVEVLRAERAEPAKGDSKSRTYRIRVSLSATGQTAECTRRYRDIELFDRQLRATLFASHSKLKVHDMAIHGELLPHLPSNRKRKTEATVAMQCLNISHYLQSLLMNEQVRGWSGTHQFFNFAGSW
jgi:hypothetical protein